MANLSFDLVQGRPPQAGSAPRGLQPRQWQSRLVQLMRARLVQERPGGQDVLIHAGPGAGKTLGALLGFQRLHQEGRLDRFLVFCHRASIAQQWQAAARRLGLQLERWDPELDLNPLSAGPTCQGLVLSYQSAARHRQRLEAAWNDPWLATDGAPGHPDSGSRWLAIADEVHHLGIDPEEPEAAAWGHAFGRLTETAALRLGLTGTPFRADNLAFCAARRERLRQGDEVVERITPDLSVEPRQLIAAGDVRPLEFRFQDGWVEHGRPADPEGLQHSDTETSPLSAESRESWRARNLRRAIRLGDSSSIALRMLLSARSRLERVRREHPEAGGLVIARDINHAGQVRDLLVEQGDRVHLVHSQDPDASEHLRAFQDGDADWLVSIDMCAEGFDAPRLRVVAYLTTVVTRSRFVQAITRAVRMDASRASLEAIPRHPSYVFAPADPLLIAYARSWSLSEPYLLRGRPLITDAPGHGGTPGSLQPLEAIDEEAGAVIRLRGPQLPGFLQRPA
ncbi:helicase C-terminal domain [Cyanobium sp. PCC 7001]|uniref:DEAD/DEAH box helicase n=1 Tax=Cyanobium sp. PCC 7001 TaxID=180281 RepID=UPI000180532B|nr:DEAD/DEAH box helicase family protein [Cyanobium sp. PCC 7001]EDY39364.1 helicase C-terminal domain [Cyanobium sp. PCC 7001]